MWKVHPNMLLPSCLQTLQICQVLYSGQQVCKNTAHHRQQHCSQVAQIMLHSLLYRLTLTLNPDCRNRILMVSEEIWLPEAVTLIWINWWVSTCTSSLSWWWWLRYVVMIRVRVIVIMMITDVRIVTTLTSMMMTMVMMMIMLIMKLMTLKDDFLDFAVTLLCYDQTPASWLTWKWTNRKLVVCQLLNIPAACLVCLGHWSLIQLHLLSHWNRSCKSDLLSYPVSVYWHWAEQSQHLPCDAR